MSDYGDIISAEYNQGVATKLFINFRDHLSDGSVDDSDFLYDNNNTEFMFMLSQNVDDNVSMRELEDENVGHGVFYTIINIGYPLVVSPEDNIGFYNSIENYGFFPTNKVIFKLYGDNDKVYNFTGEFDSTETYSYDIDITRVMTLLLSTMNNSNFGEYFDSGEYEILLIEEDSSYNVFSLYVDDNNGVLVPDIRFLTFDGITIEDEVTFNFKNVTTNKEYLVVAGHSGGIGNIFRIKSVTQISGTKRVAVNYNYADDMFSDIYSGHPIDEHTCVKFYQEFYNLDGDMSIEGLPITKLSGVDYIDINVGSGYGSVHCETDNDSEYISMYDDNFETYGFSLGNTFILSLIEDEIVMEKSDLVETGVTDTIQLKSHFPLLSIANSNIGTLFNSTVVKLKGSSYSDISLQGLASNLAGYFSIIASGSNEYSFIFLKEKPSNTDILTYLDYSNINNIPTFPTDSDIANSSLNYLSGINSTPYYSGNNSDYSELNHYFNGILYTLLYKCKLNLVDSNNEYVNNLDSLTQQVNVDKLLRFSIKQGYNSNSRTIKPEIKIEMVEKYYHTVIIPSYGVELVEKSIFDGGDDFSYDMRQRGCHTRPYLVYTKDESADSKFDISSISYTTPECEVDLHVISYPAIRIHVEDSTYFYIGNCRLILNGNLRPLDGISVYNDYLCYNNSSDFEPNLPCYFMFNEEITQESGCRIEFENMANGSIYAVTIDSLSFGEVVDKTAVIMSN